MNEALVRMTTETPMTISNSATKFTALQVKGFPRGSLVKATCKAPKRKKCPGGKTFTKKNASGTVSLKKWAKKSLRAGTKITATVTKAGNFSGMVKILTVKKRKAPSIATRCLPPGARKAVGC